MFNSDMRQTRDRLVMELHQPQSVHFVAATALSFAVKMTPPIFYFDHTPVHFQDDILLDRDANMSTKSVGR